MPNEDKKLRVLTDAELAQYESLWNMSKEKEILDAKRVKIEKSVKRSAAYSAISPEGKVW